MSTVNAKEVEKHFNEYLSKLIYAVFKDIETDWNGPITHSPLMYQTYDNLCKEKQKQADGVKNRFTIADPTRQYLTFMFGRMIEELKNIAMVDGDTAASIRAKLVSANAECYTDFMYSVSTLRDRFGSTLKNAADPTMWFHNQIVGCLPQYVAKPMLIAIVSTEFDAFLKSLAWLLGKLLWYTNDSVSANLFLGTMARQGMSQLMLDLMAGSLRDKPPAKPRQKKTVAGAAAPGAATPATTTPGTPGAAAPAAPGAADAPAPAPDTTTPAPAATLDEIKDVLANV